MHNEKQSISPKPHCSHGEPLVTQINVNSDLFLSDCEHYLIVYISPENNLSFNEEHEKLSGAILFDHISGLHNLNS